MLRNPYKTCRLQAEEIKSLQYKIGSLNTENKKLQSEIDQCKDRRIVEKLLELNKKNLHTEVLKYRVEISKYNHKVICYLEHTIDSRFYYIRVWGVGPRGQLTEFTVLMFDYNYNPLKDHQQVIIQDIQNESSKDKGYGSLAMKMLLEFPEKNRVHEITGKLVPRDLVNDEERARRVHFYQSKFGFSIEWLNETKTEAHIYLKL